MLASLVFAAIVTGVMAATGLVRNIVATGLACTFVAAAILTMATTRRADALVGLNRLIKPFPAFLLLIPCLFMAIQIVPIPMGRLANAAWSSTSTALGFPLAGSVTIDTGASLIALAQYCVAAATAIVVACITFDRRLAELALYLLTATAAFVALLQIIFVDLQASLFAAAGVILSCATGIRLYERLTHRRSSAGPRRGAAIGLAAAAFSISTISLLVQADTTILFGALFGAATPLSIFIIRKYHLSAWGMAGFVAGGAVILFAFLAIAQAKRDVDPSGAAISQSPPPTERMISDARLLGSGAGTFERLLPIYRELDDDSAAQSATASAIITIEMGRPFLWGTIVALIVAATMLVRASLLRGRDHAYAGAGAGIIIAIVVTMFVSDDILDVSASLFLSATIGLAWGQSRGSAEKIIWAAQSNAAEAPGTGLRKLGPPAALTGLQFALAIAGLVLTVQAVWILLPEYVSHGALSPFAQSSPQMTVEERGRLQDSATIAAVRGDLWAKSALAGATLLLDNPKAQSANDDTRRDLINALRYSPYQSVVWLTFARLSERYGWSSPDVKSLLKMAYYTGPNEANLIPERVKVALRQSNIAADPELQDMIGRDVSLILRRLPNLKPALAQAIASASADGKALVQKLVGEIDPSYLGALHK